MAIALDANILWRKMVVQVGVSGVQVHDARIAACLRVHGVTRLLTFKTRLLTFNTKDFARYAGFVAVDPAQVSLLPRHHRHRAAPVRACRALGGVGI